MLKFLSLSEVTKAKISCFMNKPIQHVAPKAKSGNIYIKTGKPNQLYIQKLSQDPMEPLLVRKS